MRKRKITRSCISIGLSVMMALSTFAPAMSVYADEVEEDSYLESVVENTENEINEEYSSGSDYEDSQSWEEEQQEEDSSSYEENYSSEEMEQDNSEVQTEPQTEPGSASEEIQSEVTTPEPEQEYQEVVPTEAATPTPAQTENEEVQANDTPVEKEEDQKPLVSYVSAETLESMDFSSKRLIVGVESASDILDPEHVISEYEGVYLLQYDTEEDAMYAYAYYYGRVPFVEPDAEVVIADDENPVGTDEMTENANPLNELEKAVEESEEIRINNLIALIDTGANENPAVVERVSMVGDDVSDQNGHGDRMVEHILSVNPNAKILSIKAIGNEGVGNVSSVYAAIKYAIEQKANIINLSISAFSTADNAAVSDIINEAINNGIIVVGAAGNNGRNVKYYVPGKIDAAVIVGACDENGVRIASSNYGDTVDYNVVAEFTSEAAAKMSAYLSANKTIEVNTNNLIFAKDYIQTEEEVVPTQEETGLKWNGKLISEMTTEELYYAFLEVEKNHPDRTEIIPNMTPEEEAVVRAFYASDFVDQFLIAANTYKVTTNGEHLNYSYNGHEGGSLIKYLSVDNKAAYCVSPSAVFNPSTYDADRIAGQTRLRAAYSYALFHGLQYFKTGERCADTYSTGCLYGDYYVTQLALWDIQDALNKDADDTRDLSGMELLVSDSSDKIKEYVIGSKKEGKTTVSEILDKANKLSKAARSYSKNAKISGDKYDMYSAKEPTVAFSVNSVKATKSGNFYQTPTITLTNTGEFPEKVDSKAYVPVNSIKIDSTGKALDAEIVKVTNTTFYVKFPAASVNSDTSFSISTEGVNVLRHVAGTHNPVEWPSGTSEPQSVIWGSNVAVPITKTASMSVSVTPESYFYIKKKSSQPNTTNSNSNYSLKDTTFSVYATEANAKNKTSALFTLKCTEEDAQHIASTPLSPGVQPGTYYVRETVAGKGYKLNDTVYPVVVTTANTEDNPKVLEITNEPQIGYVCLKKSSTLPDITKGNPNYSLEGTKYTIYKTKADAQNLTNPIATLTCGKEDANGIATTQISPALAIGKYYLRETDRGIGYKLSNEILEANVTATHTAKNPLVVNATDEPWWDPGELNLIKKNLLSASTGKAAAEGLERYISEHSLSNTEFTISFYAVTKEEEAVGEPTRTWVVGTVDESGVVGTKLTDNVISGNPYRDNNGNVVLPFGVYKIEETKAAEGYVKEDAQIIIDELEGVSVFPLFATLKEGDNGIKFLVENNTIGNSMTINDYPVLVHTIATDANTGSHSSRAEITTLVDRVEYENLLKSVEYVFVATLSERGKTDAIATAASEKFNGAGIKEKGTVDVTLKDVDLKPYEGKTLIITEKVYEANSVTVAEDGKVTVDENGLVAEHTEDYMTDEEKDSQTIYIPKIRTKATDGNIEEQLTGHPEQVTRADEGAVVNDVVTLTNLNNGSTYIVKGQIMKITENGAEPFIDADGNEVVSDSGQFVYNGQADVTVKFTFNAKDLDGTKLVVFEKAYLVDGNKEIEIAEHQDENDKDQFDYIPEITTELTDDVTGINHTLAEGERTVTDKVTFTDAKPRLEYTMYGVLMDKETQEELTWTDAEGNVHYPELIAATYNGDDAFVAEASNGGEGNLETKIPAHARFIPTAESGEVYLTFKFDAKAVEGKTVVAFETMRYDDKDIAIHADLESEPQTDYIPKVRTALQSDDTKTNISDNNEEVKITDTVAYSGVEVGRTYYLKAELHRQVVSEDAEGVKTITDGGVVPSKMFVVDEDGVEREVDEVSFVPETKDGTYDVHLKLDASAYEGESLVAFEKMYTNKDKEDTASEKEEVGKHEEITDERQTLHIPKIRTTAVDSITGIHMAKHDSKTVVYDDVVFENLVPGKEYVMHGRLMIKPEGADEEVQNNTTTDVVTDNQETDGNTDTQETDGEDTSETDDFFGIDSGIEDAIDTLTGNDDVEEEKSSEAETLTAEPLKINGKEVTATRKFTPKTANGTIRLAFEFDSNSLEGQDLVAFELLTIANPSKEDVPVAEHEDPRDPKQSVAFPKLRTVAKDGVTVTHVADSTKNTLVDHIDYENLEVGREYTFRGTLHDKADGSLIASSMIDANGNDIDGYVYKPEAPNGSIDVTFRYDATNLAGHTIVVYENVSTKITEEDLEDLPKDEDGEPIHEEGDEVVVGEHADINDEDQSIHVPSVSTSATDAKTGLRETQQNAETVITDHVTMKNLIPGMKYKLVGVLMSKNTKKAVMADEGKEITVTEAFEANAADMEKDLSFKVNTTALTGDTVVVFEKLYLIHNRNDGAGEVETEVARHEDIEDEAQSVKVVDITTTLFDKDTETHETGAEKEDVLVDRIYFKNLTPGRKYYISGKLYDKKTGKPVKVGGKEVTAKDSFTASVENGYVDLEFPVNTKKLAGKTVVAFEDLLVEKEGKKVVIAIHHDINDEDQSVKVVKISTKLTDAKGKKKVEVADKVTLVDTVKCKGLTVGQKYTLKGVLMDKETNKSTGIEQQVEFEAEKETQEVKLEFEVNTNDYAGKKLVAFESLYNVDDKLITSHEDINDADQTIEVAQKPGESGGPGTPGNPSTGDKTPLFILLMALAAAGVMLHVALEKKRRRLRIK